MSYNQKRINKLKSVVRVPPATLPPELLVKQDIVLLSIMRFEKLMGSMLVMHDGWAKKRM